MNARYYLPSVGRFVSADTIVPNPANPQDFNRYSYVSNNPLNYIDPTGHKYVMDESSTCGENPTNECIEADITGVTSLWLMYLEEEMLMDAYGCEEFGPYCVDADGYAIDVAEWREAEEWAMNFLVDSFTILASVAGMDIVGDVTGALYCAAQGQWGCVVINGVGAMIPFVPGRALGKLPAARYVDEFLGACSFSEDTLIMTEDGLVAIAVLEVDDLVLAYDEETGEIGYYPITAVWVHEDPVIVYLTIEGETIITTPEHPFYTEEGLWIAAGQLQVGVEIRSAEWDTGTVQSVHFIARPQTMYNLTVAAAHTFFVGDEQWLVHNTCPIISDIVWPGGASDITDFGRDIIGWGSHAGAASDLANSLSVDSMYIRNLHERGVTSEIAYKVADWYNWAQHGSKGGAAAAEREVLMRRIGKFLEYYE